MPTERQYRPLYASISLSKKIKAVKGKEVTGEKWWRIACHLVYTWLLGHQDDDGRLRGRPGWVIENILPYELLEADEVAEILEELQRVNLIQWYMVDDEAYIQIVPHPKAAKFRKDRYKSSFYPSPYPSPPIATTNGLPESQPNGQPNGIPPGQPSDAHNIPYPIPHNKDLPIKTTFLSGHAHKKVNPLVNQRKRKPKPKPKQPTTNPHVKEFLDFYYQEYKIRFNVSPIVEGGKDGSLIKSLLTKIDVNELKNLFYRFLDSDDPWIQKSGYTIGAFHSQINKLRVHVAPTLPEATWLHAREKMEERNEKGRPKEISYPVSKNESESAESKSD